MWRILMTFAVSFTPTRLPSPHWSGCTNWLGLHRTRIRCANIGEATTLSHRPEKRVIMENLVTATKNLQKRTLQDPQHLHWQLQRAP